MIPKFTKLSTNMHRLQQCLATIFLILSLSGVIVGESEQQHHIDLGDAEPTESNGIIRIIPVKQFFDVENQKFKLGYIAEGTFDIVIQVTFYLANCTYNLY